MEPISLPRRTSASVMKRIRQETLPNELLQKIADALRTKSVTKVS